MALSCQETIWHSWPELGACWESGMDRSTSHMLSQFDLPLYWFKVILSATLWYTGRKMRLREVTFPRSPSLSPVAGTWHWLLRRTSQPLQMCFPHWSTGEPLWVFKSNLSPLVLFFLSATILPTQCQPPSSSQSTPFPSLFPPQWYDVWTSNSHQVVSKIGNGRWWEKE